MYYRYMPHLLYQPSVLSSRINPRAEASIVTFLPIHLQPRRRWYGASQ